MSIRPRSKKMALIYVARRKLVAEMLEQNPICVRCGKEPSTEVHEILSRARGGSILDKENCAALCHKCHFWITTNPREAHEHGWLKHSWEKNADL